MTASRPLRLLAAPALAATALLALLPASASAHGLVGKADLPLPTWLFAWAAAIVLVISFAALGLLWPQPRLQRPRERRLLALGAWADVLLGAVGLAIFALTVYAGFAGTAVPTANFAPTTVYVVFWVGLVVASMLFGDVFRLLSPWRALARAAAWLAGRLRRGGAEAVPEALAWPRLLGQWPAVVTIAAFAWLELVSVDRDDPQLLAILALVYGAIQLIGMSVWGIEAWSRNGDGFGAFFGLFARIAPLTRRAGALWLRRPLDGLPSLPVLPGTVALLCVMIGSTTFDGASGGPLWTDLAPHLQSVFEDLGMSATGAGEAAFTVGLLACFLLVALVFRLGILGMRTVDRERSAGELAAAFVHTLVPIALAYALAHYASLLIYQGQAYGYLLSDPLGNGSDLLGTASWTIDYTVISATGIWYLQVVVIVLGHIGALVLAHDRALALYRGGRAAIRSQIWMLTVMVAFTCLALWLISAANQ
ncbi:fenitrothion hydrolase [Conexibacter sp. JD483]|uniref:fenitrothion hydrolase n=1 Tax=unclassified Conexibacter TaxID=2627773 RepID=UPI00271A55A2|nr:MULTISPECIES: fenitrothion hydrolase [unclassified Conexibacter]MDO8188052.1 fenitrothion hydrolase [Conexibacter sp. CPCC 205706]MDO8200474.1 fenitrothion hydrolase [Conexibacter sp. CPCC 205762]MDR9369821.1 fenitrothion hydrolase [Conexibacter sp. JD483]